MISGRPSFEARPGMPEINRPDIMGAITDMLGVCLMVHMRIESSQ